MIDPQKSIGTGQMVDLSAEPTQKVAVLRIY